MTTAIYSGTREVPPPVRVRDELGELLADERFVYRDAKAETDHETKVCAATRIVGVIAGKPKPEEVRPLGCRGRYPGEPGGPATDPLRQVRDSVQPRAQR